LSQSEPGDWLWHSQEKTMSDDKQQVPPQERQHAPPVPGQEALPENEQQVPPTEGEQLPPEQDELTQQVQEMGRTLRDGLTQVSGRLRQVFGRATQLWDESAVPPPTRLTGSREEEYVRQLAKRWTQQEFLVTPDLIDNMAIESWERLDLWEFRVQTRWETRAFEVTTEPYSGAKPTATGRVLPLWDYVLPVVSDPEAREVRERLSDADELAMCLSCNGSGRIACSTCTGKGWVVCSDCKGRTKLRCPRCKGKAIIPDWGAPRRGPGKNFFQSQAEQLADAVKDRANDMVDSVRQYVPLPGGQPQLAPGERPKGMIPCPECVDGEIECSCGSGKRVCTTCQGVKTQPCPICKGSGQVIRHREIVRRFEAREALRTVGEVAIPEKALRKAEGDVIMTVETIPALEKTTPPAGLAEEVWRAAQEAARTNRQPSAPEQHATFQSVEFLRVPVVKVGYTYGEAPYSFYAFGAEGKERFFAEGFPPRWKRVERFVRSVAQELITPTASPPPESRVSDFSRYKEAREGGRQSIPVEMPRVVVQEEAAPPSESQPAPSAPEHPEPPQQEQSGQEQPRHQGSEGAMGPLEG
jgi:hypothetical protein